MSPRGGSHHPRVWRAGFQHPHCLVAPKSSSASYLPSRYCGQKSQFVVSSNSSKMTVRFHSDQSYTDTGFLAEYLSYDSNNREWMQRVLMGGGTGTGSALSCTVCPLREHSVPCIYQQLYGENMSASLKGWTGGDALC